jgi:hypothetical protein
MFNSAYSAPAATNVHPWTTMLAKTLSSACMVVSEPGRAVSAADETGAEDARVPIAQDVLVKGNCGAAALVNEYFGGVGSGSEAVGRGERPFSK